MEAVRQGITATIGGEVHFFPGVDQAMAKAVELDVAISNLTRHTLRLAYVRLGELLLAVRPVCPHGQWRAFLARHGVHYKRAIRAIRMAEELGKGKPIESVRVHPNETPKTRDRSVPNTTTARVIHDDFAHLEEELRLMAQAGPPQAGPSEDEDDDEFHEEVDDDEDDTRESQDDEDGDDDGDDDELEDRVVGPAGAARLDEAGQAEDASAAGRVEEGRGAAGPQLTLVSVWEGIDRLREAARSVARDTNKAQRVADAVRRCEAEIEEIRSAA